MPDLSHRPSRYATAAVALALVCGVAATTTDVSIGASDQISDLQGENAELREQLAAAEGTDATEAGNRSCAAFGTQEEAQVVFDASPSAYPDWDGNGNGVACQQLKSGAPQDTPQELRGARAAAPKATPRPTATVTVKASPSSPASAAPTAPAERTRAPKPPAQELPPAPAAKPTAPSKAEIMRSREHFGLYAATNDEYDAVEATTAKDTTIHGFFQGFDTRFRSEQVNSYWSRGEIPLLTWETRSLSDTGEAYPIDEVADGAYDAYIRQFARDIKANGLPLGLRFDQEMNGNWYNWAEANPNETNSKGSYIRAWRHVHDLFEAEGANDLVIWVWSPNRVDNIGTMPSIDNYYPGDEYVDWVGMTGYYRSPSETPTFEATYGETLDELRRVAPGKPILLTEIGATENGGKKLEWMDSFFEGLPDETDVIGFVWFNYAITDGDVTNDWRITSTSAVTEAFREGIYEIGYGRDRGKQPGLVTVPGR